MGYRKIDARRVKSNRSYLVGEVAVLLGVHKNTVKNWLDSGLPHLRECRPFLILGEDLKLFIGEQRQKSKKPCPSGHMFCMKCKDVRRPSGLMLDYTSSTPKFGNLKGICEVCETFMYRRISPVKIIATFPDCHVVFPQAQQRLTEPV